LRNRRTTAFASTSLGPASAAEARNVRPRARPENGVPPTTVASPSAPTRITVGGCNRTYTAKAKDPVATTPNKRASTIDRLAYALTHLLQLATPSSRNLLIPHEAMPSTQKA